MAVTNQTLIDTSFKTVIKTVSDNAANSAVSILDASAISLADTNPRVSIAKIWYSINTANNKSAVEILWDGATNATALVLSGNGYWVLRTAGDEITNNATTPSGDILLSTKNFAVGDNYTIIIEFR